MLERNTSEPGYGSVAILLHWLTAALLVAQFGVAWTMPDIGRGTQPIGLISVHLSIGMVILLIVVPRLIWRLIHPVPLISSNVPLWQHRSAQAIHGLLYLVLIVLPLLGWANASSRGWSVDLFALVALPGLLPEGAALGRRLGDLHVLTSYALLVLVGLHVAAALHHRLWLRDPVLSRMLPLG